MKVASQEYLCIISVYHWSKALSAPGSTLKLAKAIANCSTVIFISVHAEFISIHSSSGKESVTVMVSPSGLMGAISSFCSHLKRMCSFLCRKALKHSGSDFGFISGME